MEDFIDEEVAVDVAEVAEELTADAAEEVAAHDVAADVERLVAEAEQRGYLRGRNEAAAESMNRTALLENVRLTEARALEAPDPTSLFLTRLRPDVWD